MENVYQANTTQIFTLIMVMMGPSRLLAPFTQSTHTLNFPELRKLALNASIISLLCLLIAGLGGSRLLEQWDVEIPVLMLAGGIVFFVTALRPLVMSTVEHEKSPPVNPGPATVALDLELTPYGIALVIVLMASSQDMKRTLTILGCIFVVIVLNFVIMIYGRAILKIIGILPLKILNTALGIMQLALASEMIVKSLRFMHII